jgi:hypothetical protein
MPTSSSYSIPWLLTRAYTYELQKFGVLDSYRERGFNWIRRYNPQHFKDIVRHPTLGCCVELTAIQHPGTVPIDSWKGQQIIKKLCYF